MGKRAVTQTVGAVLLGFNVAVPIYLDAQGFFPNWPWQYHALIGFAAFVIFVGWVIWDKQQQINKLKSVRPVLTLGKTTGVSRKIDKQTSIVEVDLNLFFKNIGTKAAYQFHFRFGFAPENNLNKFELSGEKSSVNRIDPNNDFEVGQVLHSTVKYQEKNGNKVFSPIYTLIHCLIRYSDSPSNGNWYEDEYWFSYRADRQNLGMLSKEQKDALEPYVREAYKR